MPDENPYAPSQVERVQAESPWLPGYRSLRTQVRLVVSIYALTLASTVYFSVDWALFGLGRPTLTELYPEITSALESANQPVFWLGLLGYFLMLREARVNAGKFVDYRIPYSPASMIYWFFVPVMSLWKPYQAVSAVWLASHPPDDERPQEALLVKLWWAASLASAFSAILTLRSETAPIVLMSNGISALSTSMDMLLLLQLVDRQEECAGQLGRIEVQ